MLSACCVRVAYVRMRVYVYGWWQGVQGVQGGEAPDEEVSPYTCPAPAQHSPSATVSIALRGLERASGRKGRQRKQSWTHPRCANIL